jgi:hypothetical protein
VGGGATECTECAGGYFSSTSEQSECEICVAGTYSTGAAYECTDCPEGYDSGVAGSTGCSACPAGTFTSESCDSEGVCTSLGCVSCDPGFYSPVQGSSECVACPPGTFSEEQVRLANQSSLIFNAPITHPTLFAHAGLLLHHLCGRNVRCHLCEQQLLPVQRGQVQPLPEH